MEEAALLGVGSPTRASVQKDYGLAGGVAALFEIDVVDRRNLKTRRVVRLY